jgi:hypothetical protein
MKKFITALVCVFTGVMAQDAFAAITFKRFPHCPEGPVTVKLLDRTLGGDPVHQGMSMSQVRLTQRYVGSANLANSQQKMYD